MKHYANDRSATQRAAMTEAWRIDLRRSLCVFLFFAALTALILPVATTASILPVSAPSTSANVLDLSQRDSSKVISLTGVWQIDYQSNDGKISYVGPITVPSLWRKINRTPSFSGLASGTYQLSLILPSQKTSPLSFHLPWASAAQDVRFFYNNQWHPQLVSSTANAAQANYRHPLINLPTNVDSLLVEISINSNFSTNGGIEHAPLIGPTDTLLRDFQRQKTIATAISAIIFAFALVNLALWTVRPSNTAFLLLGALAVIIATRIFVSDSDAIYDFLPNITISQDTTIGWLIFLLGPVIAALYFFTNYRPIIGVPLLLSICATTAIATGLLVLGEIPRLQAYGNIHRPLIALLTTIMVFKMVRVLINGRRDMLPSVISSSLVILGFAVETLHFQAYGVVSPYLAFGIGWLAFLAIETYKITNQYRQSLTKIDQLTDENKTLNQMAHIDPLTALPNRRAFDDRCMRYYNDAIDNYEKNSNLQKSLAVMVIDLDFFKKVNDQYGHDIGDAVLVNTADALRSTMRQNDFVARLGGEEFCLLLPNTDKSQVKNLADRLLAVIGKTKTQLGEKEINVTASIGISFFEEQPLLELIRQADQALYVAKDHGRNGFQSYWELEAEEVLCHP